MKRRRLVLSLPAVVVASIQPRAVNAQSTELQESDPEAIALQYKADAAKVDRTKSPSYKPGQTCATCSLFVPEAGSPRGACQVILGKDVTAVGWCNAWEKKAQ